MGGEDEKEVVYHLNVQCCFRKECCDSDVIHVVFAFLPTIFLIPGFKDSIHETLEGCRGVAHSEKHDFWFKEPLACLEGSFPLITVANSNVVISPSYVKLAEEFHALEIFDTFCKIWERGNVFSSDSVEWSIVDDISQLA